MKAGVFALICGLATAVAAAGPAWAQTETPEYFSKQYFFQCRGDVKVQNVNGSYDWTVIKPAHSYQSGAGCGWLDSGLNTGLARNDGVFGGVHEGAVKAINVELHDLLLTQVESNRRGAVSFHAVLEVDDEVVIDTRVGGVPVTVTPQLSSSGLTQKVEFSIFNLDLPEDLHRSYRLTIMQVYVNYGAAWVFGASEIPAGVEFNPAQLKPARVR